MSDEIRVLKFHLENIIALHEMQAPLEDIDVAIERAKEQVNTQGDTHDSI